MYCYALALLIGVSCNKAYASQVQNRYEAVDNMIIESYYDYISDENWNELLWLMGNEYEGEMESYINSSYYQENNLGVYSIEKVNSIENKGLVDTGYSLYSQINSENQPIKSRRYCDEKNNIGICSMHYYDKAIFNNVYVSGSVA